MSAATTESRDDSEERDVASSRTAEEVFERVRSLEEEHDLLRYLVQGWCAWPVLRFAVAGQLAGLGLEGGRQISQGERWRLATSDARSLLRLRRARVLIKTYTSGLAEQRDGRYHDVWFDDLIAELGGCFKLESVNSSAFLPRRLGAAVPSNLTTTLLDRLTLALRRIQPDRAVRAAAAGIGTALATVPELSSFSVPVIAAWLAHFDAQRRLHGYLLDRVRPERVLVADPGEHALVAAARERAIPIAELQHGINDRYHPGYSWTAYARSFRARMPVPDQLLLYGEHWRRELDAGGFWGDSLQVVGCPRIDYHRARESGSAGDVPILLVTSQGIDTPRLARFLGDALRVRPEARLRLVVKLHPVYDAATAPFEDAFGGDRRAVVLTGTDDPSTFELLRHANLHVSVSSACHYDALALGVPTAILPLAGHELVAHLARTGHASIVRDPADLFASLDEAIARGVEEEVSHYYCRHDALRNLRDLLA